MKKEFDNLKFMFDKQKELQIKLVDIENIKSDSDKQQYINQNLLAMFEETVEIMRETKYKNSDVCKFGWKKNQHGNLENYKNEIIDLFHFMMNLCIIVGMDSDEFFKLYLEKNKINFERKENGY